MSLYAIGDLHLSLGTDKPMDVFGGRWENYVEKIKEGFSVLNDDDLTVICGDISWGMSMDETLEDFKLSAPNHATFESPQSALLTAPLVPKGSRL